MKRCLLLIFDFLKHVLGPRYKLCYSILTLFLKNSQDYVVMISHFGQKKPNKSPDLFQYRGQNAPLYQRLRICKKRNSLYSTHIFSHEGKHKKLSNFAKLQFLHDKIDPNTNFCQITKSKMTFLYQRKFYQSRIEVLQNCLFFCVCQLFS